MTDNTNLIARLRAGCPTYVENMSNNRPGTVSVDEDATNRLMRQAADALEAGTPSEREKRLEEVLFWYADTFCELGPYAEACGKLPESDCSGCRARTALAEQGEKK